MVIGIAVALSLLASLALNYGMYINKVAVGSLPKVGLRMSSGIVKAFLTNRKIIFAIGLGVVGGTLYAVSLGMAPVSIVQPLVASGVVLLAYLAIRNLGERPRKVDYFAIGMTLMGVVLIGVSLAGQKIPDVKVKTGSLAIFASVIIFVALIVPVLMRNGSPSRLAAGLGVTVGLLYGIGAVFAKLLINDWSNGWHDKHLLVIFSSFYLIAWLFTYVPAIVTQQAALQRGMAVVVVPILSGMSQLVPILVGMIALNERLPDNPFLAALRILAFCLIMLGTIILSRRAEEAAPAPAPVRAASQPAVGEEALLAAEEPGL
jgi:drug/metabolite transporter (DMT)-like permease